MARSRPGDDRGNQRGEGCRTLRRPSDHGVPLAAPVSGLARLGQAQDVPKTLTGIVEADETFVLESFNLETAVWFWREGENRASSRA